MAKPRTVISSDRGLTWHGAYVKPKAQAENNQLWIGQIDNFNWRRKYTRSSVKVLRKMDLDAAPIIVPEQKPVVDKPVVVPEEPVVVPPTDFPPPASPRQYPVVGVIDIVNYSTELPDDTVREWIRAQQVHCDRDFAPFWGKTVRLDFIEKDTEYPRTGHWYGGIFDESDDPGVLGWHSVGPNGEPLFKILMSEIKRFNRPASTTFCHEVDECIANPDINITITVAMDDGRRRMYFQEVGDPVQDFSYDVEGVPMSDFVTPYWFMKTPPPDARFSFLNKVRTPFEIAEGGYMLVSYDEGRTWYDIRGSKVTKSTMQTQRLNPIKNADKTDRILKGLVFGSNEEADSFSRSLPNTNQRRYKAMVKEPNWVLSTFKTKG